MEDHSKISTLYKYRELFDCGKFILSEFNSALWNQTSRSSSRPLAFMSLRLALYLFLFLYLSLSLACNVSSLRAVWMHQDGNHSSIKNHYLNQFARNERRISFFIARNESCQSSRSLVTALAVKSFINLWIWSATLFMHETWFIFVRWGKKVFLASEQLIKSAEHVCEVCLFWWLSKANDILNFVGHFSWHGTHSRVQCKTLIAYRK